MNPLGWVRKEVADALERGITCSAIISPVEMVGMVPMYRQHKQPDCKTCANRGRIYGFTQEIYCEHCTNHQMWREDHYLEVLK